MKRNEKILALGLVCVVVGYFGWPAIDSFFLAPTRDARAELARIEKEVGDKNYERVDLETAKVNIEEWSGESLPPDPSTGQRLYMQWLSDMARMSGLKMAIDAGTRVNAGQTYTAVRATLTGDGTFAELKDFLETFRRVDLLHRVVSLEVKPAGSADGNPRLPLVIVVEGLCLRDAEARSELFPQTTLENKLEAGKTALAAFGESISAQAGDRLRVGDELIAVVEAGKDTLTIERGVTGTDAAAHEAGAEVELYPSRQASQTPTLNQFAKMRSPFVKPHDYEPKFEGLDDLKVVRGNALKTTVSVGDFDPMLGEPSIDVAGGPEGMTFDAATGELSWTPGADIPAKTYSVQVTAKLPGRGEPLKKEASIVLAEPNTPPAFAAAEPKTVFHGETLEWELAAKDGETPEGLTYAVEGAPEGASIDAKTGKLTWSVPESFKPGNATFTVKATDTGEPAMSAQQSLTVTVKENLKPYVYLVSTTREGETWDAWLWDRSEGKRISLYAGKPFEAVGISGVVEEISADRVRFQWNGELWTVELGKHLGEMERVATEPVAALKPPVEAPRPGATVVADARRVKSSEE